MKESDNERLETLLTKQANNALTTEEEVELIDLRSKVNAEAIKKLRSSFNLLDDED